jgi:Arc-like DNA binding domain
VARKPTDIVHLKLRFAESLRRQLEREAARNHRSMNTEIIHRLEESIAETIANRAVDRDFKAAEEKMTRVYARVRARVARESLNSDEGLAAFNQEMWKEFPHLAPKDDGENK